MSEHERTIRARLNGVADEYETAVRSLDTLSRRLTDAEKRADEAERRPQPIIFQDGDFWIAWIDYMAQGSTEDEVRTRFSEGWVLTVAENQKAGITPAQMIDARYHDYPGQIADLTSQLAAAKEEIARLKRVGSFTLKERSSWPELKTAAKVAAPSPAKEQG